MRTLLYTDRTRAGPDGTDARDSDDLSAEWSWAPRGDHQSADGRARKNAVLSFARSVRNAAGAAVTINICEQKSTYPAAVCPSPHVTTSTPFFRLVFCGCKDFESDYKTRINLVHVFGQKAHTFRGRRVKCERKHNSI